MISHENEIPEGTKLMLLRFAHPRGESGNPQIGSIVRALEVSDGVAQITNVTEETGIPADKIATIGSTLRGVFEISGENLICPSLQQEVERAT